MDNYDEIVLPFSFNMLKHHMGYIHRFVISAGKDKENRLPEIIREIKRVGSSVTDIYSGSLSPFDITTEAKEIISSYGIHSRDEFIACTGKGRSDHSIITLSDKSSWIIKPLAGHERYIHIFPSRGSLFTTREKGNSVKTTILLSLFGLDRNCTLQQLNEIRKLAGLPPVRSLGES